MDGEKASLVLFQYRFEDVTIMACELIWEPEGVLSRFSGTISGTEFLDSVARIQSDARFDDIRYVIHDLSSVAIDQISDEVLTELSVLHFGACASCPNCRVVLVTTDAALGERVERVLMAPKMKSYEVKVRPSVVAARDWLDSQPQLMLMSDVMGFWSR